MNFFYNIKEFVRILSDNLKEQNEINEMEAEQKLMDAEESLLNQTYKGQY